MAKRKEDPPPAGAPAWTATFGDLMNLLLCFYVLLFSMSTLDTIKFEEMAASLSQAFSIFTAGSKAIGDGKLVSNGVSQMQDLLEYVNQTGVSEIDPGQAGDSSAGAAESTDDKNETAANMDKFRAQEQLDAEGMKESEQMAEEIREALEEMNIAQNVDVDFNSQYVVLTINGAILFDSGQSDLRKDVLNLMSQVGIIVQSHSYNGVEIEGHTDSVPINTAKYPDNDVLSFYRALSVYRFLSENTYIPKANMKFSGRGENVPVADNSTPEGRALNRRVEIKLYNDLNSIVGTSMN